MDEPKDVRIDAVTALAFQNAPDDVVHVAEAEHADKVLGDEGNSHWCPLCHQFFGTVAFKAHAQACINARAAPWERQRDREPVYHGNHEGRRFNTRRVFALGKRRGQK